MRTMRYARAFVLALTLTTSVQAQSAAAPSPTEALLIQLRELVDGFEYRKAIQLGANNPELIGRMRTDQLEMYLILTAAAYFPPDADSLQNRELALSTLEGLVRLRPDARIPVELSWDGLDALLDVAASQVFSVALRPAAEYVLDGSEKRGMVTVIASRPTDFRLTTVDESGTVIVVQDSVRTGSSATLGFRVHDGVRRLLVPGENQFRVLARDVATGDSTELRFDALVAGTSPPPLPIPALDSSSLLPVHEPPRRGSIMRTGVFYALVTGAIAAAARAEEPLRSSFTVDARAFGVSAMMIGAAVTAALRDPGRPLPQNVAENARRRAAHEQAVARVVEENRKRSLQYEARVSPLIVVTP